MLLTGKPIGSNAFLSPQWGGVMIYNINAALSNNTDSETKWMMLNMESVMKVFIPQLKLLLGVLPVVSIYTHTILFFLP